MVGLTHAVLQIPTPSWLDNPSEGLELTTIMTKYVIGNDIPTVTTLLNAQMVYVHPLIKYNDPSQCNMPHNSLPSLSLEPRMGSNYGDTYV